MPPGEKQLNILSQRWINRGRIVLWKKKKKTHFPAFTFLPSTLSPCSLHLLYLHQWNPHAGLNTQPLGRQEITISQRSTERKRRWLCVLVCVCTFVSPLIYYTCLLQWISTLSNNQAQQETLRCVSQCWKQLVMYAQLHTASYVNRCALEVCVPCTHLCDSELHYVQTGLLAVIPNIPNNAASYFALETLKTHRGMDRLDTYCIEFSIRVIVRNAARLAVYEEITMRANIHQMPIIILVARVV